LPLPVLTLVTGYPFNYIGAAPKRFIVRADLRGTPGASVP
jgi:sortase (surface protein transpeptidase)